MKRKRFLRPLPPGLLNPINAKSMPKGSSLSLNRHGLESSSLEASTTASEKKHGEMRLVTLMKIFVSGLLTVRGIFV